MSIMEIVVLGIVFNYVIVIVLFILTYIYTEFQNKFDFENMKKLLKINHLLQENKKLMEKCKKEKILYFTQEDFIVFVPYSGIIEFFIFINVLISGNLDNYVISKLYKKNDILTEKIKKHK